MNLKEIKQAVDSGLTVHWANDSYRVIKDTLGQYLIKCRINGSCIGLHGIGGEYKDVLNGAEHEFYYGEQS